MLRAEAQPGAAQSAARRSAELDMMLKLLVVAVALSLSLVDGFSSREFKNPEHLDFACRNLYPKHDPFDPQTANNPYSLTVTNIPGGKQVTISGAPFKGFILQANSGQFGSPNHPVYNMTCSQGSTIRHADATPKDSFSVSWFGSGPVSFKGSAVQEWTTFYKLSA